MSILNRLLLQLEAFLIFACEIRGHLNVERDEEMNFTFYYIRIFQFEIIFIMIGYFQTVDNSKNWFRGIIENSFSKNYHLQ